MTDMLGNISLFSDLADEDLKVLTKHTVTRVYPKNNVIIHEGDSSDALFVVVSGRVKAFLSDEKGKEIVLNHHGPGEYFGEMALFDDEPRSASVITLEKTSLSMISKSDFEACLRTNPQVALHVIRGLIKRLRIATDNVRSLALMDVYGRVARILLQLAEQDDGQLIIREKLTHQDIADRVGSSREMVSRIFKDLKSGGYIEFEDKCLKIKEKLPHAW
ncbi:MAG: Crp/Fnr family transcriptional regulator [Gammaproteobacteria bacterium]